MKEDLIEVITKLVFNEQMSNMVTALCRICTKDEERTFLMKISEMADISTSLIGLSQYFTLDESSKIKDIFYKEYGRDWESNEDGDVGGSSSSKNQVKEDQDEMVGDGGSSHERSNRLSHKLRAQVNRDALLTDIVEE